MKRVLCKSIFKDKISTAVNLKNKRISLKNYVVRARVKFWSPSLLKCILTCYTTVLAALYSL